MTESELDFTCPFCGTVNEAVTALTSAERPTPGSVMLCIECLAPGIVNESGTAIRVPDDTEQADMLRDSHLQGTLAVARHFVRKARA